MTAPTRDGERTAGYLMCANRRYGCDWAAVYRTFADEPAAREIQRVHHLICPHQPTVLDGYPWSWTPNV